MTDKTIFIHIGLEKTGTTSIQDFLFYNAKMLRNKSIFYSTSLGKNQTSLLIYSGQTKYIGNLASEKQEMKIKKGLPQTIKNIVNKFKKSNCKNLVFSNEHLSSRLKDTNDIKRLKELFDQYDYPVKIVMYVRNQIDLLESLYFEAIKAGEKKGLSDWANNFTYFELDLIKMLGEWESIFGKDSITLRLFDRSILKNGDAIDDFLDLLSVEDDENLIRNNNQNTSLGYKSIEFMRAYNSQVPESIRVNYKLNNLLNNYNNDKQKITLSPDDRVKIFNKYNISNQEFLKKYLPEISYEFFIKTSRKSNKQNFSEDTLWDIINHIINQKGMIKIDQEQSTVSTPLDDPWYRFGQMSKKKKLWTMGKVISKKIKFYWLFKLVFDNKIRVTNIKG